jgi:hypothetical protein
MPRQATMTVAELQWVRAIHWNNEHTRLIAAALNDPRACVGFDASATLNGDADSPRVGCWLFARMCKVQILAGEPLRPTGDWALAPVVWHPFRDEVTNEPLPIYDPRMMTLWNAGDTHRHVCDERAAQRQRIKDAKARAKAARSETHRLRAKDEFGLFARWADAHLGFVGREGSGGERRWFYDGALKNNVGATGRGKPTGIIIATR